MSIASRRRGRRQGRRGEREGERLPGGLAEMTQLNATKMIKPLESESTERELSQA